MLPPRNLPSRHNRLRTRAAIVVWALVSAVLPMVVSGGTAQAATMTTLYASPAGTGTACSSTQPCSITQAQTSVRAINAAMTGDIVVQLADSTYRRVVLEGDSNGDGYLDSEAKKAAITAPVWLRLTRSGTSVTAYYSADGTSWTQIGTATLSGSSGTEDVGMFSLSHDTGTAGTATFSQFSIS